jgi:hypothetical protein
MALDMSADLANMSFFKQLHVEFQPTQHRRAPHSTNVLAAVQDVYNLVAAQQEMH